MRAQPVQRALIGFIVAFGITATIAALTTIRHVHHEASSIARPMTRG